MSLLIESIKLIDGEYRNLFHHEQRMNRSLKILCGLHDYFVLDEFLSKIKKPEKGLFKCRILYDDEIKDVEFLPYDFNSISSLRIIEHDRIHYEFKYKDRKIIDRLFGLRKNCDDILIIKNGLVTDSSYANIVFKKDKHWYTPWSPLLKGTQRQSLLEQQVIEEEEIRVDDIKNFDAFKLINAMLEFTGPEIDVKNIVK